MHPIKKSSIRIYENKNKVRNFRIFLNFVQKDSIKLVDIEEYLHHLKNRKNKNNKPLSISTIQSHIYGISSKLKRHLIATGRMRDIGELVYFIKNLPIGKNSINQKVSVLSKKDIHKLLSVTSHSSHGTQKRNYALVQILLQTGMRVGELVNLETRDLTLYDRSGEIRIVSAKGGKERVVSLNSYARKALRNYLEERCVEGRVVFISKQNKKMTVRAVQKVISNLSKKAGIKYMSPHTLRHTFAINYLRSNPECLVELSTILGHESLDTTSIYTMASKERLADTIESTGDYINE